MKQFNILIVDDDPDDHLFVKSAISEFRSQINLISVYDGMQGLKYLGLTESDSVHKKFPDLILCDINMPFIDGINFLETVKKDESYKNIPICILTTSCDECTKQRLISLGAMDCIIKPSYMSNYKTILAKIFNNISSFDDL
ncbi:MAG: response regulator [Bacteroidota bacterium]|nr:response regulator [Bacteroidota bacterium]